MTAAAKASKLIAPLVVFVLAAPAARAADTLWTHNGSVVRYLSEEDRRLFIYEQPRAGIAAQGVEPGTILFDGRRSGNRVVGTARIFKRGCRRADYPVEGLLTSETEIILAGRSSTFAAGTCDVVLSSGSGNDTLVFRYLGRATAERPRRQP